MVSLEIYQQFARLGMQITPFHYDLNINSPNLLIKQQMAEVNLEQPAATLEIDFSPARESIGYAGITDRQQIFNEEGLAVTIAGIERRVQEGNEVGFIENHIPLPKLLAQMVKPKEKQLDLVSIAPVRISVHDHPIHWEVTNGGVSVQLLPGTVQGDVQYGRVRTYLEQENYVDVRAVGQIWDVAV